MWEDIHRLFVSTTPFYTRDSIIHRIWYPQWPWNQSSLDTWGPLFMEAWDFCGSMEQKNLYDRLGVCTKPFKSMNILGCVLKDVIITITNI